MQNRIIIISFIVCFEKLALCNQNIKRRNPFESTVNTGANWPGRRVGDRCPDG